jgi:hypothetical protein
LNISDVISEGILSNGDEWWLIFLFSLARLSTSPFKRVSARDISLSIDWTILHSSSLEVILRKSMSARIDGELLDKPQCLQAIFTFQLKWQIWEEKGYR